jgi:SAM-dependent methyltransferase
MSRPGWIKSLWYRIAGWVPVAPTGQAGLLELAVRYADEDAQRLQTEAGAVRSSELASPQLTRPVMSAQAVTDGANTDFWNELCGSQLARSIGVVDDSAASLKRFDDWYFDFYPYLQPWVPLKEMVGRDVLEIGLGYGSLSQVLAQAGARYIGLDIAAGPVRMVNHRLALHELAGRAEHGSILAPPFAPESFDFIVAVGSLHHTGNLQLAIDNCHAILRPGGRLCLMVYYAYSYRQFVNRQDPVLAYAAAEAGGWRGVMGDVDAGMRAAYDADTSGRGAPHTDFVSRASLRYLCRRFERFDARLMNIDLGPPFQDTSRKLLLSTEWPGKVGLDLYATAGKTP